MGDEAGPIYSPFFGVMGATSAMVFSGKILGATPHLLGLFIEALSLPTHMACF
jgi:hypothetical protein